MSRSVLLLRSAKHSDKQNTVKLKHQLADGTVDESEVDKYRNEFCEDMTKPSEVARRAPAAKTGGKCKVENPKKVDYTLTLSVGQFDARSTCNMGSEN